MKTSFSFLLVFLSFYAFSQPTNGLVGQWSFNGNSNDISGNDNHATNNGATLTIDRNGNADAAFEFDGVNDYMSINSIIDDLETSATGSWAGWIKNDNPTTYTQMIFSFTNSQSSVRLESHILGSGKVRFLVLDGSVQWILETDNPISANTWYHILLVQDGISPKIYLNGILVPQTFTNTTDKTYWFSDFGSGSINQARISSRLYGGFPVDNWFDGVIDDVAIYNRNLSESEVNQLFVAGNSSGGSSLWSSNGSTAYYDGGNVAIGTNSTPSGFTFAVSGKAIMEEVKVEAAPWPDYVFSSDYNLKSLDDLEKFILLNKHLPNVPSEVEVMENGVALGEMNAKLLEKIEELTLYTINQEKQLKKQEQQITRQEKLIQDLVERIGKLEQRE